eukprot:c4588_g1_i1.p1 GENE.c4588_g1_i1~~c4588_g1_i1.p1  ORF type:complete len:251 (+),score=81.49 c4588_g1_i1:49-801(+)
MLNLLVTALLVVSADPDNQSQIRAITPSEDVLSLDVLVPQMLAALVSSKDTSALTTRLASMEEHIRNVMLNTTESVSQEIVGLQSQLDALQRNLSEVQSRIDNHEQLIENTQHTKGSLCRLADDAMNRRSEGYANMTTLLSELAAYTDSLKVDNSITDLVKKFAHSLQTENRLLRESDNVIVPSECVSVRTSVIMEELPSLRETVTTLTDEIRLKQHRLDTLIAHRHTSHTNYEQQLQTLDQIREALSKL